MYGNPCWTVVDSMPPHIVKPRLNRDQSGVGPEGQAFRFSTRTSCRPSCTASLPPGILRQIIQHHLSNDSKALRQCRLVCWHGDIYLPYTCLSLIPLVGCANSNVRVADQEANRVIPTCLPACLFESWPLLIFLLNSSNKSSRLTLPITFRR